MISHSRYWHNMLATGFYKTTNGEGFEIFIYTNKPEKQNNNEGEGSRHAVAYFNPEPWIILIYFPAVISLYVSFCP